MTFPRCGLHALSGTAGHRPLCGLWWPLLRGGCCSGPGSAWVALGPGPLGRAWLCPDLVGTAVSQRQGLVGPQSCVCPEQRTSPGLREECEIELESPQARTSQRAGPQACRQGLLRGALSAFFSGWKSPEHVCAGQGLGGPIQGPGGALWEDRQAARVLAGLGWGREAEEGRL